MRHAVGLGQEQSAEAMRIHRPVSRPNRHRDEARRRRVLHHVGQRLVDLRPVRPAARARARCHERQPGQAGHRDVAPVRPAAEGAVGVLSASQPGQAVVDRLVGLGGHQLERSLGHVAAARLAEPLDRLVPAPCARQAAAAPPGTAQELAEEHCGKTFGADQAPRSREADCDAGEYPRFDAEKVTRRRSIRFSAERSAGNCWESGG